MGNYRLSINSYRSKHKRGFVIETEGRTLRKFVCKTKSLNIKEDILITLTEGLRALKPLVKHEDIVFIEIQNTHLQQWLSGLVEYKEYSKYLDEVFEVLEGIDCKYKFVFSKEPSAKQFVLNSEITTVKATPVGEALKEFE